MNLFNEDNMIFWEKVDEAAQYVVHLSIQSELIGKGYYSGGFYHESSDFLMRKHKSDVRGDIVAQVIDVITIPREKTYHTFSDLVSIKCHKTIKGVTMTGLDYYATVIAEDREGKEIDKASILVDIRR